MGASHSSEPDVIAKEDIETPEHLVDDPDDSMYELPELDMDWFWNFI
jgi:hypothetical protein